MPRALVLVGCAVVLTAGLIWFWRKQPEEALFEPATRKVESAPLCPWREPEADLRAFFPEASGYVTETRVLSGLRVELAKHLGRPPEPEENALTLHPVFAGPKKVGMILTRRVKGEYGAIEVVLATNQRGEVHGVRLQRLREPEAVANRVRDIDWLGKLRGRTHDHGWEQDDVTSLPEEARVSGKAIREGVRSLLILQAAAAGRFGGAIERSKHSHSSQINDVAPGR